MSEPMVACIMLTADRPAMAARAIRSFLAQTYKRKRLYIWDTSTTLLALDEVAAYRKVGAFLVSAPPVARDHFMGATIGKLRNAANKYALAHWMFGNTGRDAQADVLIHWDDDDYSHPCRIQEQVELLVADLPPHRRVDCVGYNDALFWDTRKDHRKTIGCGCGAQWTQELHTVCPECAAWPDARRGEAWLYRSLDPRYVIGSSMCYWADAWRADPFDDAPHEDQRWWLRNAGRCLGVRSFDATAHPQHPDGSPRLICSIHGANTSEAYRPQLMTAPAWTRQALLDGYLRERMAL